MAEAIRLAWRGLYTTHPNPRVGCVIVKDGLVVGRGWHEVAGQGHAEVNALRAAGSAAKGATVYVSLEPCSHHGKTPPCANALIGAGVAQVISAMEDPNPKVSGNGHRLLQQAGIHTACGLLESQARAINPGFYKRMQGGLPWVILKSAMSVDGRIAMASGESQWISCSHSRADVQRLRARVEAVITGVETVLLDNPALNVRPALWPKAMDGDERLSGWHWPEGLAPLQPLRVIVDSRLRTPPSAAILQGPGRVLIACTGRDENRAAALEQAGAEIVPLPARQGRVDLSALLCVLAAREVNEVLVETGGQLAGSFVAEGLVDEWVCYMAPKLLGSQARPVLSLPGIERMAQAHNLQLADLRQVGQDIRMTYHWSR